MKLRINEKETPDIEVKNKGILEVPEGKNVNDLPLSHFVNLANKKGLSKITKALNNLQVWNKNDDPKLSKWAGDMIDKLNKKLKKDESVSVKDIRAKQQEIIDTFLEDVKYALEVAFEECDETYTHIDLDIPKSLDDDTLWQGIWETMEDNGISYTVKHKNTKFNYNYYYIYVHYYN